MIDLYKGFCPNEVEYFDFISKFTKELKPKRILEIGSGWGISACAFLLNSDATLITIDSQDLDTMKLFVDRIEGCELWDRVEFISSRSEYALPEIREHFDLVYVDGGHTYDLVKRDLELAFDMGDVILMDDFLHRYNWTGDYGVNKAVCEFCKENGVSFEVFPDANGFVVMKGKK